MLDTPPPKNTDTFPPNRVLNDLVKGHDAAMLDAQDDMGLSNAVYLTKFWEWYVGWGSRKFGNKWRFKRDGTDTEDNRLWKEVQTYTAALYPRASRVMCKPDPMGRGDADTASAVLNAWWEGPDKYLTVRDGVEMAILFPGCAFKVGYEPGAGSPIERVYVEPVPPWEVMLDRNAQSRKQERYRGHIYQAPIEEIEAKYGDEIRARGGKLTSNKRRDFLWTDSTTATPGANNTMDAEVIDEDGRFVRVLEFCNKVDSIVGRSGEVYKGRLEVYILDQSDAISKTPIAMTPLPFTDADGRPMPHIIPLMFAHEPAYPFRPVAPVARLLPLQVVLNKLESQALQDVRRNARKGIIRKGALSQDHQDKFMSGIDMEFAEVQDETIRLNEVAFMFPHQPIAQDTIALMARVDGRLQRQAGGSPNARQEVTGATAYEIQTVQLFTEEGLKFHALLLAQSLDEVSQLALSAIGVAGTDYGDSAGGDDGVALAPVGDVDGVTKGSTDTDAAAEINAVPVTRHVKDWRVFTITFNDETFEVTDDALRGNFAVKFVQGERTPISDQAMLTFLTGPGAQQYMALLGAAIKGGPEGLIAERFAQQIAERADLPRDLHPGEVLAAVQSLPKPKPEPRVEPERAPAPPATEPPPPGGGADMLMGALQSIMASLQAVVAANPESKAALMGAGRAIGQAIEAAAAGDGDGVQAAMFAARQALSAVDMQGPEIDAARAGVAQVIKAMGGDSPEVVGDPAMVG